MVVDPSIERAEPGSGNARDNRHADPILQTEANSALERWLQDHPQIEGELKDTVRAHIHFQELEARTREAERMLQTAEQRYATLQTRHDVAGHRIFGWTIGLALVVALVVLDAVPLNWAAQAFGLDSSGTWLVTCILVVASVGAMVGIRAHQRALAPARVARRRRRGRLPRAARAAHSVPDNCGGRVHARRAAPVRHADGDLRGAGALRIGSAGSNPVVHAVTLARASSGGRDGMRPPRGSRRAWRARSCSGTLARYGRCCCPGHSARPRRPALTGRSGQLPSGSLSVSCSRCRD